jgi:hypothetical protein
MNRQYGLIINNIHYIASIILSFSFISHFVYRNDLYVWENGNEYRVYEYCIAMNIS